MIVNFIMAATVWQMEEEHIPAGVLNPETFQLQPSPLKR